MCYSIVDIEIEIDELGRACRSGNLACADNIFWRISQMLPEVPLGTVLRNRRMISAVDRIAGMMEFIPKSKYKKILEMIIKDRKEEIKNSRVEEKNAALFNFQEKDLNILILNNFMNNRMSSIFFFCNFRM